MKLLNSLIALTALVLVLPADALAKAPTHPYILWTPEEAAALRKQHEAQAWAREKLDLLARQPRSSTFINLYRYQVLGDDKAGEQERKYLLSFINAPVSKRDPSGHSVGKHYDNYLHALRYDVLYDSLTEKQRKDLENTFRRFIQYELDHPYHNNRLSLLPNMQLPRLFAAHIMSVTVGDEQLIRKLWAAPSGFRWYMDEYLSDGGFYNEEFGKMTSLIGEMLIYCRGLDRIGLSELGYDFEGRGGATMRRYVESYFWMGYPRTEIPGGMPRYGRVSMGDARGGLLGIFQHCNVQGELRGGDEGRHIGGYDYFYAANMNGRDHRNQKTEKLQLPQWFEILHARYPDGPFSYFLAQMRDPGAEAYIPTPFWGLTPIKPADVKAPPAPSAVYPERGFAMLRAEQSLKYWESPRPAVALQFATLYVHYTSDCFSLLGYHAFNRPIYVNRTISAGYNGGPWDFSVRGHCGVVVDGEQAQPIGRVPTRRDFSEDVTFVSARGALAPGAKGYKGRGEVRSSDQPRQPFTDVYSNMDLSRSLFLTDGYLFDVYWLADKDGRKRDYHWLVHAPGVPADGPGDNAWKPSDTIQRTLMNVKPKVTQQRTWEQCDDPAESWIRIENERELRLGEQQDVDVKIVQECALEDPAQSQLGKAWYDRKIGVRVRLLAEPGTAVYRFDTPTSYRPGTPRAPRDGTPRPRPETGGTSIAVTRTAPETIFVALHEPFENGTSKIDTFERLAQTNDAVAARVQSKKLRVDDRLMVRIGDEADKPITLAGGGESFTFAGHAHIRIKDDLVKVRGDLRAMRLKAGSANGLMINGKQAVSKIENGMMVYPAR